MSRGPRSPWVALYGKEVRAFFDTPTAYVVTSAVLLISGYLFSATLFLRGRAVLDSFFNQVPLMLLFLAPAITMRLYSEEVKSGTAEILATLPVTESEVLWAKYLASMTVITFYLAASLVYPVILSLVGSPDWGAILCGYSGAWLSAAVICAAGLWTSSLTRNQLTAFILSLLIAMGFFLVGKLQPLLPPSVASVAAFLGLDAHLNNLTRGVIDVRDLLYYASLIAFFLYLTYLNARNRRTATR
jgi:ABC-2 type transport system permease protein